jgi:hypothetical protein
MNALFKSSLILLPTLVFGGVNPTPLVTHKDVGEQREFQNMYQNMAKNPSIFIGAGAPSFAPQKAGDIFISTSTSKVYISKDNVDPTSWLLMN